MAEHVPDGARGIERAQQLRLMTRGRASGKCAADCAGPFMQMSVDTSDFVLKPPQKRAGAIRQNARQLQPVVSQRVRRLVRLDEASKNTCLAQATTNCG